ncbi:MAG TPA: invasion associated locus B family protein [Devosiaceae bacterium]
MIQSWLARSQSLRVRPAVSVVAFALASFLVPGALTPPKAATQADPKLGWARICETSGGKLVCKAERDFVDSTGKTVAVLSVWKQPGSGEPNFEIKVPLDTLIPNGLILLIDQDKKAFRTPFHYCDADYCVMDTAQSDAQLDSFKNALADRFKKGLTLTVTRTDGTSTSVSYHIDLRGFTAAYEGK